MDGSPNRGSSGVDAMWLPPVRGVRAMWTLIAVPLTCWLCVLLAFPRKPRVGNEVEGLVYARLLGRQQRLLLLALLVTALTFLIGVATLPRRVDADLSTLRHLHATC